MANNLPKILFVDDEIITSIFFDTIVNEYAINIIHAYDGDESVAIYKENPDILLIFMNIKMRRMQGTEACSIIKKINPQVIIVADTAYCLPFEKENIMKHGFDEYITRPCKPEAYREILRKYIPDVQKKKR